MAGRDETAEIPLSLIGTYPDRWEPSTLGRACSLVTDGTHDSPKETQAGFPLVTGRCITGGRINLKAAYFISERDHKEVVSRSKPEFGDILFANIGNSIGELARVETNAEFSIKNVALFKPGPRLESLFLKYYLLSAPVQAFIRGNTFGSAQPFVGLGTLRSFPIPLPPLPEQKRIAHILGTLDDKIELNRRMNKTLENMARELFKSWFIDFDPVRAKSEGLKPEGMDAATAKLFPSSFEDSELGRIPKGWKAGVLGEVLKLIKDAVIAGEDIALPYVPIDIIPMRSLGLAELRPNNEAQSSLIRFKQNDILMGAMRVYFHRVVMAPCDGITRATCFVLRPRISKFLEFCLLLCDLDSTIEFAQSQSKGTTMPYAVWQNGLEILPIVIPPIDVVESFSLHIKPILTKIRDFMHESQTLATLRDTLLPKLLSGELSVSSEKQSLCY
jgi:type I restriction enzyme S subunit